MPYGDRVTAGSVLFTLVTPVTTAASPVTSQWISTDGVSVVYAICVAAGGTSVVTLEWGFDGQNVDTDITATTVTPLVLTLAAKDVLAPFVRVKWTQTVGNATISKLTL